MCIRDSRIATVPLGRVKGGDGVPNKVLGIARAGKIADPHRHRDAPDTRCGATGDDVVHAFGGLLSTIDLAVGKQPRKLIASQSREHVPATGCAAQMASESGQYLITDGMSVLCVELFEPIDIDHNQ